MIYPARPYPSWTFKEETIEYLPPIPVPQGKICEWNEELQNWIIYGDSSR